MSIVSQSKGLSQIPDSVWKRYGVADPSKLDFKVVPRSEYNSETGQQYDTFDLVDKATGITLDQGNLGQVTGDLSGSLIPDEKGNLTYQVQKGDPWSLEGVVSGAAHGVGDIAKSNPMLVSMIINALAPGVGTALSEALGVSATTGAALAKAGMAAATGGNPLTAALPTFGNVDLGGINVGQVMTAANVLKSAESGDWMNALSGAASLSGASNVQIGDTGYTLTDLAKNAKLAQAVMSGKPQALLGALTNFAKTAQANTPLSPDVVKTLTDAGLSKDDVANTDWASLYAQETTDPTTGQTIKGADLSQYANQNFGADPNANWNSYVKNVNNTIGNKGGMGSQWQQSGSDHIMVADDGSGIGINENGDSYALTPEQVTQMVKNGQLNTAASGYVTATGGTGNTPGGSGTKTTTTSTTKTTPTTPSATAPAALAAASWYGINPADLVKADKNDVLHIKSFKELFGHDFSAAGNEPAPSAQDHNISKDDILQALEDTQNYAGGGDIHALLQLLRS